MRAWIQRMGWCAGTGILGGGLLFASPARPPAPVLLLASVLVDAQDGAAGAPVRLQRVDGRITAIAGANLTLRAQDGTVFQVVTTDNTRLLRSAAPGSGLGGPVRLADLRPGFEAMAAGNLDGRTMHAALVVAADPVQVQALREALGKSFITGRVTAIHADRAQLTLQRPDGVTQTIGLDKASGIRRGGTQGDGMTLAEIRVGDNVTGKGEVKNGLFVPTQLIVGGGAWLSGGVSPNTQQPRTGTPR